MHKINHYEANSEFRYLYSEIEDRFTELEAFLKHIHGYVALAESKLGPELKLYSADFFEYYYAGSYGETFRNSFIVSVSSVSEAQVKNYVTAWISLLGLDISTLKPDHGILDYLKTMDKELLKIDIDFSKKEINDFRGLLAVRNAIVHSDNNLEYVSKYVPIIKQFTKAYPSIKLTANGYIRTDENFCSESIQIARRFFFYLYKLTIRKFPNHILERPVENELYNNYR